MPCGSARPSTTAVPGRSRGWRSSPAWWPTWWASPCSDGLGLALPGHRDVLGGPGHVDALARARPRGVDHVEPQVAWNVHPAARRELEAPPGVLHVRQTVHVELEDLRRDLHAQAVAGAQVLVDPH